MEKVLEVQAKNVSATMRPAKRCWDGIRLHLIKNVQTRKIKKKRKKKFKPGGKPSERERRARLSLHASRQGVCPFHPHPAAPPAPPYPGFAPEQLIYERWLSWSIKK